MLIEIYHDHLPEEFEHSYAELFIEIFTAPPRNESWNENSALEFIRNHFGESSIFAAAWDDDHNLVGVCFGASMDQVAIGADIRTYTGITSGFYLSVLGVIGSARQQGIGRQLMGRFLEEVTKQNQLCIGRAREDASGIRHLFNSFGFYQTGEHQAEIAGALATRHYYVKELQPRELKTFHFEGTFTDGSYKLFAVPAASRPEAEDKLRAATPNLTRLHLIEMKRHF